MRRFPGMRARCGVSAALLAAMSLLSSAVPSAAALDPAPTTSTIGLWAPDWAGAAGRSEDAWTRAARNHDLLVGNEGTYGPRLSSLHATNPSLTVLVYDLGPYLSKGSPEYRQTLAEHPEYFARNADGGLISVPTFPHMTLMDQSQPGWRALHVQRVRAKVQRWGFDGVYVDCMGWGPVSGFTDAVPMNRRTGRPYTAAEWLRTSVLALDEIKAAVGSRYVMWNGLTDGPTYREASRILATSRADGGLSEGFLRPAKSPIDAYPSVEAWRDNLDMMIDMAARGKDFFAWTKTWTDATAEQRRRWNTFALATYLLGKGSSSYYNFLPDRSVDRTSVFSPEQQARLGAPLGAFTVAEGVYTRRFRNGVVRVDPARRTASIVVS